MPEKEKDRSTYLNKAVALKYNKEETAPKVVASGRGYVAEKLIELAKSKGVPVHEDPALVEILAKMDINELIPPELYNVIAEILAFVYRLDRQLSTP